MRYSQSIPIEKKSLLERGVPEHSYFHIVFNDNSEINENECNWSDLSEEKLVSFMGGMKRVFLSKHPIKKITINHAGLKTEIEPREDERVYQSIRSISVLMEGSFDTNTRHLGRVVGIVNKDGRVIEERFISNEMNEIFGIRL